MENYKESRAKAPILLAHGFGKFSGVGKLFHSHIEILSFLKVSSYRTNREKTMSLGATIRHHFSSMQAGPEVQHLPEDRTPSSQHLEPLRPMTLGN